MGRDKQKGSWDQEEVDNSMNRTQDTLEAQMRARGSRQGNTLRPPPRTWQQPRETPGNTSMRRHTQSDTPSTSGVAPSTSRMRTRLTPSPSPARPSTSRDSAPSSARKRQPPPVRPSTSRQLQPPPKSKTATPSKRNKSVSGSVFSTAERPQASNTSMNASMAQSGSETFPATVIAGQGAAPSPIIDEGKVDDWRERRKARAHSRNKRKTSQEAAAGLNSPSVHLAKRQKTKAKPSGLKLEQSFDIKQERDPISIQSNSGVEISLENSGGVYESTPIPQRTRLPSDSSDEDEFDYSLFYIDKNSPYDTFEESRIPTGDTELPPLEKIQLPKKGRDSSIFLKRLSNWQRFVIEKGKELRDNDDMIPQTWGWSSSDPDPFFENELKFDEDRSRKCENFLNELKKVDFECNMDKLPQSRHTKEIVPREPLANLEIESEEGKNTNQGPVRDVAVADVGRVKGKKKKHEETYDSLFMEENNLEKQAIEIRGSIIDYDWEIEKDDGAAEVQRRDPFMNPYFDESLRYWPHYKRCPQREAIRSNVESVEIKRPTASELANEEVKILVDTDRLKEKMARDHRVAKIHESQLEREAAFWKSKKASQQALKYNAWDLTEESVGPSDDSEKGSVFDPPDYESFPFEGRQAESSYFMQNPDSPESDIVNPLYRLSLHGEEPRFFNDGENRGIIYNSGEDGYFEAISFKEGDNWVGLANAHRDMVASLFHEIEKSIKQLDEELENGNKLYYQKMKCNKINKSAPIYTQAPRHHTGIKYITTLLQIASDLALGKLEVRLEITSNQSFKSFFKSLLLHGRPQNFGPFVAKKDLLEFVKATLGFLTVLLGHANVCMCDPGDPMYDEVYEKLGAQFYANVHAWFICVVTYGFRHEDKEYLEILKPRLISFVRVYEHTQYERYRARKDYNLQFYGDVVESNLNNDKPKSDVLKDIMENYSWKYPIHSLLATESHRTHGLLHVIEHLTNLGTLPVSRYIFLEWTDRVRPREHYDRMSFNEQHAHLMLTQGYRYEYHRFFPMAENHMDNTSIQQLLEFYQHSLQKLTEALPENSKELAKKSSEELVLEDIVAMKEFVDILDKYIDIFGHGIRSSLGIAHPFKKPFEPFTPADEMDDRWKMLLVRLQRGTPDVFWTTRMMFAHQFSLVKQLVEPLLLCLPESVRYRWVLLRDVVRPEFTSFISTKTRSKIPDPMEEATRERENAENYTRATVGETTLIHGEIFNE